VTLAARLPPGLPGGPFLPVTVAAFAGGPAGLPSWGSDPLLVAAFAGQGRALADRGAGRELGALRQWRQSGAGPVVRCTTRGAGLRRGAIGAPVGAPRRHAGTGHGVDGREDPRPQTVSLLWWVSRLTGRAFAAAPLPVLGPRVALRSGSACPRSPGLTAGAAMGPWQRGAAVAGCWRR